MGRYTVCLVTIDDPGKAAELARLLVEKKLAACVNIISEIRSIYQWKGKVCDEKEVLMIIKTRTRLFGELKAAVKASHPYEVPEIISLPIDDGLADYLQWIDSCTAHEK